MRLRWTQAAVDDLERIANYLFENALEKAEQLTLQIYETPNVLLTYPHRGRVGRKSGTRELVMTSLPYIIVYQIIDDTVNIIRVMHGAQNWP